MTYKEALFFTGKCLTISLEAENRKEIEKELKSENIDWDAVVKVSTAHYVFPALYCNLNRAGFLHYLPEELVNYMIHITDLNRERNKQIIEQAKEINELLLANNITPIFLKGTGNLLEGLYDDIAERMVGDIDVLIKKSDSKKAHLILQKNKNNDVHPILFDEHRHLPRITNSKKNAAVEIHSEMLMVKKSLFFNYETIKSSLKIDAINNCNFLSDENKLKLTIYSKMINDSEYYLKRINLRAAYDFFLISNKLQTSLKINDFNLHKELNAGIELYSSILSSSKFINLNSDKKSRLFVKSCLLQLEKTTFNKFKHKIKILNLNLKFRFQILFKSIRNKSYRKFLISRLSSLGWFKRRILGIR